MRYDAIRRVLDFIQYIGQIPVLLKQENHSYVFNNMFSATNQEALKLPANYVATVPNDGEREFEVGNG